MVTTKMNWSSSNCDFLPKWIKFGPDQFILVVTISFWSWPNHYVQAQINLVIPKPFWTDQNCFGLIEGQGNRVYKICIPARCLKLSPKMTPPMTPARVARVRALPLRQPFTFSLVNFAMVWPSLVLCGIEVYVLGPILQWTVQNRSISHNLFVR